MTPPAIILVRPQMGENIGAVARAMANFGFSELRLVAPRDGWPNEMARHMSSGAEHIIDNATLFATYEEALADIQIAYATTARARDMVKRVVTPEEAMEEISPPWKGEVAERSDAGGGQITCTEKKTPTGSALPNHLPLPGGGNKVALVFGPERTGLENDEIILCDTLITIPTTPEKASLNLAQSMVILGYEWWTARHEGRVTRDEIENTSLIPRPSSLATKTHWQGLFDQLDEYLEDIEYYRVADKKPVMWQNMRNMFLRGQWSEQEIRTFRGMLRILYEGRKPRSRKKAS